MTQFKLAGLSAWTLIALSLSASPAPASTAYIAHELFTLSNPIGITNAGPSAAAGGLWVGGGGNHAVVWSNNGSVTDLNPGSSGSYALGTDGTQVVGYGGILTSPSTPHAALWRLSGSSYYLTDLNPNGFVYSHAIATDGSRQVGDGTINTAGLPAHALLWSGTSDSAIDLNPARFASSTARAISGARQVGDASTSAQGHPAHAVLWSGSAASAVDLNPAGITDSSADGVSGTQQVGNGSGPATGSEYHALLWTGSADSVVDLNPAGFITSDAFGTNGSVQVGTGSHTGSGNDQHALLWLGSAASVVDLGTLLPSNLARSEAFSVDGSGNVFGFATDQRDQSLHAIEWSPVPEPASMAVLVPGAITLVARRRRLLRPDPYLGL